MFLVTFGISPSRVDHSIAMVGRGIKRIKLERHTARVDDVSFCSHTQNGVYLHLQLDIFGGREALISGALAQPEK